MNLINTNIKDDIEKIFGDKSNIIYDIMEKFNSKPISIRLIAKYDDYDNYIFFVMTNINDTLSYRRIVIRHNPNGNTLYRGILFERLVK